MKKMKNLLKQMFCFHKKHGRSFNGERFTKICLICGKKTVKSIWEL